MPTLSDLIKEIRNTPFPPEAKVRISITGLAFCVLRTDQSVVKFLSGIKNHLLAMVVIQRVRRSGALYPAKIVKIEPGQSLDLKVAGSSQPGNIETPGPFPLDEIVNLVKVHGNNPIEYFGPSDPSDAKFPSALTIHHAAFYTRSVHNNIFHFKESGGNPITLPDAIGYVIGGTILTPPYGSGDLMITTSKGGVTDTALFKGIESEEMVYDIIFDNHCDPREAIPCNQDVVNHGGPEGTDFFYYYEVLREKGNPNRKIDLEHSPTITIGTLGGGGEVAACNPIIVDPPPS